MKVCVQLIKSVTAIATKVYIQYIAVYANSIMNIKASILAVNVIIVFMTL